MLDDDKVESLGWQAGSSHPPILRTALSRDDFKTVLRLQLTIAICGQDILQCAFLSTFVPSSNLPKAYGPVTTCCNPFIRLPHTLQPIDPERYLFLCQRVCKVHRREHDFKRLSGLHGSS